MTAFICVANNNGILFNKRRVSRDKLVISDLTKEVGDGFLYVSLYSAPLFDESDVSAIATSEPHKSADPTDFIFAEEISPSAYEPLLDKLVIYRWNRDYPADFFLDFVPEKRGFKLTASIEFKGNSHEKITKEIYER